VLIVNCICSLQVRDFPSVANRKYHRTGVNSVRIFANVVVAQCTAEAFVLFERRKPMDLYRGENYGVFTGPHGYYIARMTADGKSYYESLSGGDGWSDEVLERCNTQAAELDSMVNLLAGIDAEAA
jgi:hypothetical protein